MNHDNRTHSTLARRSPRHQIVFLCMVGWALGSSLAWAQPHAGKTDEVVAADRALARAVAEHDVDRFRSLIADDATFFGASTVHQGRDAVVEAWSGLLAKDRQSELRWEPEHAEIAASDDLAFTTGSYELATTTEDGTTQTFEGTYVTIWTRTSAGRWQARLDIGTPPQSRPPEAAIASIARQPTEPSIEMPPAPTPKQIPEQPATPIVPAAPSPKAAGPGVTKEEPADTSLEDTSDQLAENRTPAPLRRKRRCHTLDSFDENDDLTIDFRDRYWRYFYVWQDEDGNGLKGDGEIVSVYDASVRSIDLDLASFGRTKGAGAIQVTDRIVLDIGTNGFGNADDGILMIDASRLGRGSGPDLIDPDGSVSVGLTELREGMKLRIESTTVELDCP